jgi:tRNA-dihydrouridine synthase
VDAVDLNLGCPQGIAKRGRYGSFLLEETELLRSIVSTLHAGLAVPVTCKIRVLHTYDATLALVHALQAAGASLLCIHGRTRENMKQSITAVDWDIIRRIKAEPSVRIPILANGGIGCYDDVAACLAYTGVDGAMSSEALLENPGLFSNNVDARTGRAANQIQLAFEYLDLAEATHTDVGMTRTHLIKMLFGLVQTWKHFRDELARNTFESYAQLREVVAAIAAKYEAEVLPQLQAQAQQASQPRLPPSANACAAGGAAAAPDDAATPLPIHSSSHSRNARMRRHIDEWTIRRAEQPAVALSYPSFLHDPAAPGAWYMRYRSDGFAPAGEGDGGWDGCGAAEGAGACGSGGGSDSGATLAERLAAFKAAKAAREAAAAASEAAAGTAEADAALSSAAGLFGGAEQEEDE